MPSVNPAPNPAGGTAGDFYLHLQTKRAGKIKGESSSSGHVDDILVLGWQWGLQANAAMGSTAASERRSYSALTIHKSVDRATTGLMSAIVTNDEVKEARLAMCRSGGSQEEYFVVSLKGARVESLNHSADANGTVRETLTIVFTKVEVTYSPQQTSGLRGGAPSFADEIHSVA